MHDQDTINATAQVRHAGVILKAALSYFAIVFGTGFVLGTIRVLWIVPHLGVRNAELLEQPLMLLAILLTAKWIVRRLGAGLTAVESLGAGLIALGAGFSTGRAGIATKMRYAFGTPSRGF